MACFWNHEKKKKKATKSNKKIEIKSLYHIIVFWLANTIMDNERQQQLNEWYYCML